MLFLRRRRKNAWELGRVKILQNPWLIPHKYTFNDDLSVCNLFEDHAEDTLNPVNLYLWIQFSNPLVTER